MAVSESTHRVCRKRSRNPGAAAAARHTTTRPWRPRLTVHATGDAPRRAASDAEACAESVGSEAAEPGVWALLIPEGTSPPRAPGTLGPPCRHEGCAPHAYAGVCALTPSKRALRPAQGAWRVVQRCG